jgi:hypothetical protein
LHDDVDGAALRIRVLDGHQNAFAFFVNAQDDKLPGLLLPGNPRRFDDETFDARG